jgi:hypothetical protein
VVKEVAPAAVVACTVRGRVADGWRAAAHLRFSRKEKKGGEEFLTARRSFGGRENGEEDDGGRDRRRRPVPLGDGGELGLAQKRRQGGR